MPEEYEWVVDEDFVRPRAHERVAGARTNAAERVRPTRPATHPSPPQPGRFARAAAAQDSLRQHPGWATRAVRPACSLRSAQGQRGKSTTPQRDRLALLALAGLAVTVVLIILAQLMVVRHG